jgi:hypothetical protein
MTKKGKEKMTEQELHDSFDEVLDSAGEVKVLGYTYQPSRVLKNTDPIAYRTALADYADSLSRDGIEVEGYTS